MNLSDEIRKQIEKNKALKLAVGEINNHLSTLENLVRKDIIDQVDEAYQRGLEDGKKAFDLLGAERDSEYQRGLSEGNDIGYKDGVKDGQNEAWEAASNISILESNGGYSWKEMNNIFGTDSPSEIYMRHTAAEAINKIKAYEEKQKAEVPIMAGDEVKAEDGTVVFIVTWMSDRCICGVDKEGRCYSYEPKEICGKTGRHFDIILEEMKHD